MGQGPAIAAGLPSEATDQLTLRLDKPQKKTPERRCIVTGESRPRDDVQLQLLRFAAAPDNTLVFDAAEKLPGRGCYVTADQVLLQHAVDRKLFARALKAKVTIPAELAQTVVIQLTTRILAALGLAKKSGALAVGEEAVAQTLAHGTAMLVLAANDASPRTAADLAASASRQQVPFIALPCDATALGAALGRDNTVYLALIGGNTGPARGNTFAAALTRDCARLAPFVTTINQNTARKAGQKVET